MMSNAQKKPIMYELYLVDNMDHISISIPPSAFNLHSRGSHNNDVQRIFIAEQLNNMPEIEERELDRLIQPTDIAVLHSESGGQPVHSPTIAYCHISMGCHEKYRNALAERNHWKTQASDLRVKLEGQADKIGILKADMDAELIELARTCNIPEANLVQWGNKDASLPEKRLMTMFRNREATAKEATDTLALSFENRIQEAIDKFNNLLQMQEKDFNMKLKAQESNFIDKLHAQKEETEKIFSKIMKNALQAQEKKFNIELEAQKVECWEQFQAQAKKLFDIKFLLLASKFNVELMSEADKLDVHKKESKAELKAQAERFERLMEVQSSDIAALVAEDREALKNIKLRNLLDATQGILSKELLPSTVGNPRNASKIFREELGETATLTMRINTLKNLLQSHLLQSLFQQSQRSQPSYDFLLNDEDALRMLAHPSPPVRVKGNNVAHGILSRKSYESAVSEIEDDKERAVFQTFLNILVPP